jgi:hypothetical protein
MILASFPSLQAQKDSLVLNKFYRTWIVPEQGRKTISGVLYEIGDSSVLVSNSPRRQDYYNTNFFVNELDVKNIKEIKVRRQGKGFAILAGAISGMVVGGFISSAYSEHLESTMNPWAFAFGGFIQGMLPFFISTGIGIGVGAAVSTKTKIPIWGDQDRFDMKRAKLNGYALKGNSFPELTGGKAFAILRDSVTDPDGNIYRTIALGGQVWMASNLRATQYGDGTEIPGILYNGSEIRYKWDMVNDKRKICPAGWHVPSIAEWTSLVNSLGGESAAGRKLKEGFSASGEVSQWWSSTEMDGGYAQSFNMNNTTLNVMFSYITKKSGLSVRCMRD